VSLNVHSKYNLLKFLIMKNLQNLKGAYQLSKNEQQSINGGAGGCITNFLCISTCTMGCVNNQYYDPMTGILMDCWQCADQGGEQ
jgi:succinate dehydrogenase/fumarate reductase-like Fe-S protein